MFVCVRERKLVPISTVVQYSWSFRRGRSYQHLVAALLHLWPLFVTPILRCVYATAVEVHASVPLVSIAQYYISIFSSFQITSAFLPRQDGLIIRNSERTAGIPHTILESLLWNGMTVWLLVCEAAERARLWRARVYSCQWVLRLDRDDSIYMFYV